MPARAPGSSKDPRLSETTKDVASLGQFLPATEHGSSKGSRRSESAQAASSAVQVVRARSIRVG